MTDLEERIKYYKQIRARWIWPNARLGRAIYTRCTSESPMRCYRSTGSTHWWSKYAVAGGEIDEQGTEAIRYLDHKSIFTHAVNTSPELHDLVEQHQAQIYAQKQQINSYQ